MNTFSQRLEEAIRRCGNPVLVGLDPRPELLPGALGTDHGNDFARSARACEVFCCEVIDAVARWVPAVKPQAAFFERLGPEGMLALARVIEHAHARGLLVIFDGKRNDIGSTASAYARGILGADHQSPWGADALTVSPYLGEDSLEPFVETALERQAGVFVLVKTSNPGGAMLQDLVVDDRTIHQRVGDYVETQAKRTDPGNGYGEIGAVVGATWPEQLAELRRQMPHTWFLVPGFGAQGGSAADVAGAFDDRGLGAVINSSRGIIFAYTKEPYSARFGRIRWQEAVEAAARDMIAQLRDATPAGTLQHDSRP